MKTNRISHARSVKPHPRRGTASLELMMFMPTYAAMIMLLFTVFSFARTRGEVAVEVRHEAWKNRERPNDATLKSLDVLQKEALTVGRILNGEQEPGLGLVSESGEKDATLYLKTLKLLTDIHLDHAVMTDTWDYTVIPFEDERRHRQLNLDERILVFGNVDPRAFGRLAFASSTAVAQATSLQESLSRISNESLSDLKTTKSQLSLAIKEANTKITQHRSELATRQAMITADSALIANLKEDIARLQEDLENKTDLNKRLGALLEDLSGTKFDGSVHDE